jgi:hypothetical protein
MRQAIFVVVMVAAAFLGGAVVNGPGLRWVQARLLDYMGLQDGGEIASIDLPQATSDPADPHRPGTSPVTGQPISRTTAPGAQSLAVKQGSTGSPANGPVRAASSALSSSPVPPPLPVPTAIPEPGAPGPADPQDKFDQRQSGSKFGLGNPPLPAMRQGPVMNRNSGLPSSAPPGLEPPMESEPGGSMAAGSNTSPALGPTPAPLDPSVGPALLASRSPTSSAQPGVLDQTKPDAISLEIAPAASSAPSSLSSATSPSPSSTPTSGGTNSSGAAPDWAALRHKMQSLGVTRYTVEGEPGGRVVFSCLIPLAGRQAVSQRFEAEGDDEFHAAQVAIRRIALWRATRSSSTPAAP